MMLCELTIGSPVLKDLLHGPPVLNFFFLFYEIRNAPSPGLELGTFGVESQLVTTVPSVPL